MNKILSELSPFIDLNNSWTLKDLLHPGFPTINKGILAVTHTNNTNKLFNNASFFAIPGGILTLLMIYFSSFKGISKKFLLKLFLKVFLPF